MNKGDRAFKYLFTPYSLINRQNVRESRMKMGFMREGTIEKIGINIHFRSKPEMIKKFQEKKNRKREANQNQR